MRILYSLFLIILLPTGLFSQQSVLEQYVQEGLQNNRSLSKEQLNLKIQELKVQEAQGKYLPQVRFGSSYLLAAGGRTIDFPIGDLFNPVYAALNQQAGSDAFPTDLQNESIQILLNNFHDTRLYVNQAIYNPAISLNRKTQNSLVDMQQAKLKVSETELEKEIRLAYFNYLKTLQVTRIYDSTTQTLLSVQKFNQKLVRNGKATEDILAQVAYELQKLKSDQASLLQQQLTAKAYFNLLLARDLRAEIEIDEQLQSPQEVEPDLFSLQKQALTQRSELAQLDKALEANNLLTQLNKSNRLPTLGVEASAGFQGTGFDITEDQAIATLGFGLNWSLFEGQQINRRIQQSQLQTRQLAYDKAQLQSQIQLQVIQAASALQAAQQKLAAEKAALRSAQKSFHLVNSRYRQQQALLIEYLDARNKLTQAEISLSLAKYDLLIRDAELNRALEK